MVVKKSAGRTTKRPPAKKQPVSKAAKTIAHIEKRDSKKFRLTFFQIKLVVAAILVFLTYRFDVLTDSLRRQEAATLVVVSFLLLLKPSPFHRLVHRFRFPKLLFVLIFFLLVFPALVFIDNKYQDWDNAEQIKGLARDFPELVKQIELATGLDIAEERGCFRTSEKFTEGVLSCGISLGYVGISNKNAIIDSIEVVSKFEKNYQQGDSYRYGYRNKNACALWFAAEDRFRISCTTAVRDSNIKVAEKYFSNQ